jgi:c-di-GMP-binding flagellar brake protein YcgR
MGTTQEADESAAPVTKIPLKIDDDLIVRSLTNTAHRTRAKIVGALHGQFILITEPIVTINDRISAALEDRFICSYFVDGYLYSFYSRYRRHLIDDVVCIEYPSEIDIKQVRKHRRIKVNIETELSVPGLTDTYTGDMLDISQGGCRLVLHTLAPLAKGGTVSLVFSLPNEEVVAGLECTVINIKYFRNANMTEAGLCFNGPPDELSKVTGFCEFCMFFDLE